MQTLRKVCFDTSSHGYIQVKRYELNELNLADKISNYSYQNSSSVYLEEDVDAEKYINAQKNKGIKIWLDPSDSKSQALIHSYKRYNINN